MIFCAALAVIAYIISFRQFKQRGAPVNNGWLYASRQERTTMDKAPLYRQSAIVFLLMGLFFTLKVIEIALHIRWLSYVGYAVMVVAAVYAVVSSVIIERQKTKK